MGSDPDKSLGKVTQQENKNYPFFNTSLRVRAVRIFSDQAKRVSVSAFMQEIYFY